MDPPREGVREAIQYLHDTGVDVKIITGDAKETAVSVGEHVGVANGEGVVTLSTQNHVRPAAEQLGVWNGHCVSGSELEDSVTTAAIVQVTIEATCPVVVE